MIIIICRIMEWLLLRNVWQNCRLLKKDWMFFTFWSPFIFQQWNYFVIRIINQNPQDIPTWMLSTLAYQKMIWFSDNVIIFWRWVKKILPPWQPGLWPSARCWQPRVRLSPSSSTWATTSPSPWTPGRLFMLRRWPGRRKPAPLHRGENTEGENNFWSKIKFCKKNYSSWKQWNIILWCMWHHCYFK